MSAKAGFLMPLRSVLNGGNKPDSVKLKTAAQKKELETTFHSVGCKKRQFHYPLCPCLRIAINPFPNPIVATRAQWPEIIDRHSQVRALLERDDVVNDIRQRDSAHPLTLHAEHRPQAVTQTARPLLSQAGFRLTVAHERPSRMASRHCYSNRRTQAPSTADCPPRCLARTLTMTSSLWSGRPACARNPGAAP